MKKLYLIISSFLYLLLTSVGSYLNTPEITKELFNNNTAILIGMGIISNAFIFFLDIIIINFIGRIIFKIVTKKTLEGKESIALTFNLLIPILLTHAIIVFLIYSLNFKSTAILALFLNPLIYYIQFKELKGIKGFGKKIIVLLPYICFIILDIVNLLFAL